MKRKNLILPFLALAFAVGMAFATTPINDFQTEVWMKENHTSPCTPTLCVTDGIIRCNQEYLLFDDVNCESSIPEAFLP